MAIKVALILSVILQFATAIIALSLVKRTRTNIAWWLISGGFLLMAIRRMFEVIQVYDSDNKLLSSLLSSWIGVLISILMLWSLIFIKRIFNIQKQIDHLRKSNESRVLSAIIKTEERERLHFAKELHDGLGPLLSSVKMALSGLNYHESNNREILDNATKLIDESVISLKEISNNLSPHVLNHFGLVKAIKSFINKLPGNQFPHIQFNTNMENLRYTYNLEVIVYRIVTELISNTLKHASAKNLYIDLYEEFGNLSLKIIDDGVGFNTEMIDLEQKGMGYSNIKSRLKSIEGTIKIFSLPNEGVHIEISINSVKNEKPVRNIG